MDEKKRLRKSMKETLKGIDETTFQSAIHKIHERLFTSEMWHQNDTIAVTVSTKGEIDTHAIIKQAWKENKRVVVPKCLPKEKVLDFRVFTRFEQLESVYYGLQEPKVDETDSMDKADIELVIVPGLAFDAAGYRIGFGGGYYDRFLSDINPMKVALALDEQLIDSVPYESHDIPVNQIITPKGIVTCNS